VEENVEHGFGKSAQKGVVLWITLMIMVVLLGATLLIARNTATGLGIAGNLGFKKNATLVGDLGTEEALKWLNGQSKKTLYKDDVQSGYWASWGKHSDDPHSFDWENARTVVSSGNHTVDYVIHRMCRFPGENSGTITEEDTSATNGKKVLGQQECVYASNTQGQKDIGAAAAQLPPKVGKPFYRVTSRIKGARNTASYVQSMVY